MADKKQTQKKEVKKPKSQNGGKWEGGKAVPVDPKKIPWSKKLV